MQTLFYKQHFYKQCQAEIGKKLSAKAKQRPEAELLTRKCPNKLVWLF